MAVFRPTYQLFRLTDCTVEWLHEHHIHTLLLDVDNTLSTHHSQIPLEGVEDWISAAKAAGFGLFIVSNAKERRVRTFAEKLDIPFFSLCKKPLPFRLNRAIKIMGVNKKGVLLCGDQLFTDMPAGNLSRIQTLLLTPAKLEDGWTFKIRRTLEKPLLRRYKRRESHELR